MSRVARFAAVAGVLILAGFGGLGLLELGMADRYADSDPERALGWRASHPTALVRRGEELLAEGRVLEASDLARQALRADPLAARGYRLLAEAALSNGDSQKAEDLYRIVARYDPRDLSARIWLLNRHLALLDAASAIADLDALLRAEPRLLPGLQATVIGLASRAETQPDLIRMLASDPPWRKPVLDLVIRQAPDRKAVASLVSQLRAVPGRGFDRTLDQAWIERLIRDKEFTTAYLAWVAGLAANGPRPIANLFNGDFTEPPSNQGFDWRIQAVKGARAEFLPADPPAQGLALRLSFDDQRVAFAHVEQLLLLGPGDYRFHGLVKLEDLHNPRGLVWALVCGEDGRPIASSEALVGTAPWREFAFDFGVPDTACTAQWLRLRLPARIPAEQRIEGAIWFDQLRILRR